MLISLLDLEKQTHLFISIHKAKNRTETLRPAQQEESTGVCLCFS